MVLNILIGIYVAIGILFSISGLFMRWLFGRPDILLSLAKNQDAEIRLFDMLPTLSRTRSKLLLLSLFCPLFWLPIIIGGKIRKASKRRKAEISEGE